MKKKTCKNVSEYALLEKQLLEHRCICVVFRLVDIYHKTIAQR